MDCRNACDGLLAASSWLLAFREVRVREVEDSEDSVHGAFHVVPDACGTTSLCSSFSKYSPYKFQVSHTPLSAQLWNSLKISESLTAVKGTLPVRVVCGFYCVPMWRSHYRYEISDCPLSLAASAELSVHPRHEPSPSLLQKTRGHTIWSLVTTCHPNSVWALDRVLASSSCHCPPCR